jgi:hypothetical protein
MLEKVEEIVAERAAVLVVGELDISVDTIEMV